VFEKTPQVVEEGQTSLVTQEESLLLIDHKAVSCPSYSIWFSFDDEGRKEFGVGPISHTIHYMQIVRLSHMV
jgi:hypothetical protein